MKYLIVIFLICKTTLIWAQEDPKDTTDTVENVRKHELQQVQHLQKNLNIENAEDLLQKMEQIQKQKELLQQELGLTQEKIDSYLKFVNRYIRPYADNIVKLVTHPTVLPLLKKMMQQERIKIIIGLQILFIFFMILLRSREISKANSILKVMFVNLWTLILFWVVTMFFIPAIAYGNTYKELIIAIIQVARTMTW